MKNILLRLLFFMAAAPLFFACSTSRDFASFSSGSGAYHGAKTSAKAQPATTEIAAVNQPETPVSAVEENTAVAAVAQEPSAEFVTVESRLYQAAAEAKAEAKAAKTTTAAKLNFAQKLALKKALKMLNKANSEQKLSKVQNPDELTKPTLDQNLKLALVFLIAALIASLISHLVALILLIVSLIFFLLWVLTL